VCVGTVADAAKTNADVIVCVGTFKVLLFFSIGQSFYFNTDFCVVNSFYSRTDDDFYSSDKINVPKNTQ